MDKYLSLLGILTWCPRIVKYPETIHIFSLLFDQKVTGYLVMSDSEQVETNDPCHRLIIGILNSVKLRLGSRISLNPENNDLFTLSSLVIATSEEANRFIAKLPEELVKIALPSVKTMLTASAAKREAWKKLKLCTRQFFPS